AQNGAVAGSRNNANMSTPADGTSPRMQMFVWNGINTRSLVNLGTGLSLDTNTASFGSINFSLTGELVLADDGTAPTSNGCEPFVNDVAGKIALVDRGVCAFAIKAKNAQNAGAVGVIVANNAPGVAAPGLGGADPTVTIPVLSTTLEQGALFKTALLAGPVNVKMDRVSGVERDGTIDNTIVAHEWGHYIHHRLVNCGLNQCRGQSEGWGDFTALQMVVRPGDDLDGLFALSQYSTATFGPNYGYFGIRRAPYTTDMTRNGFTFGQIVDGVPVPTHPLANGGATNAEVHNSGEVWASMMFESYVAMLKATQVAGATRTFEQARRAMSDYVVAGMKLTPVEPDFGEQRDAILAAVYASDPADMMLFANGFAKRGLGTCAVSPPKDTVTNAGAVESFTVQGNFEILSLDVDDSVSSCDDDGILDAEETGKVTIKVMNTGVTMLAGTTVNIASTMAGVVFPNGTMITLPTLEPFAVGTATIDISLDASVQGSKLLDLSADVNNVAGCMATLNRSSQFGVNYDNLTNAANIDTVESDLTAWKIVGVSSDEVWSRSKDDSGNHAWHGVDYSSLSDTSLESPTLDVSATAPLVLSFSHRYSFEVDPTTNWDAGVIEVSVNGGSWVDLSTYADPGYNGVVNNTASNPLMNRQAFVGENAAYPASEPLSVNLGTQLAGKKIKIRFRIGTDLGAGDFGWEIDNIVVQGITNTPFTAIGDDTTNCDHAPTANAGPDQMVSPSVGVILDGSASSDVDADPLTFDWKQTAGPLVPIINSKGQKPTFLAPPVLAATTLTFELDVSDGKQHDQDSVDVLVQPIAMTTGAGGAGGAGGGGGAGGDMSTATGTSTATSTSAVTSTATSTAQSTSAGAGGNGGEDPGPITGTGCDCTTSGTGTTPSRGALGASLLGAALFFMRRRRNGR
ncbi:MAG: M36 family metallopeptidase, partial [Byssovorax sp.]